MNEDLVRLKNYIEFQISQTKEQLEAASSNGKESESPLFNFYNDEMAKLHSELSEVNAKLEAIA